MKLLIFSVVFLATLQFSFAGPLRIQKRAAFYIANETACVVDNIVYSNGDPIPTDDPCESCKCRPPGFACVLKDCEIKPGCRAVRKTGHCCPDYICGCEHNGRMYRDGDEIRDSKNPCYTCHCQGSSIACAFVDCFFRVDCPPEYTEGECCPHYTHCNETIPNEGRNPNVKENEPSLQTTTLSDSPIVPGVSYVEETTKVPDIETTVIEIFDSKTDESEATESEPAVNLYAINAEKSKENEDSSESIEETEKKEVNAFINSEALSSTITPALTDSSSSETSEEKSSLHEDSDTEVKIITELTTEPSDGSTSAGDVSDVTLKENAEDSTKLAALTEEFNSPIVVENINVEPEEPSNTLELIDLPSDYGKSLRFPEQDVASNINDTKEPAETPGTWRSILEETFTDSPVFIEVATSTEIPEEISQPVSETTIDRDTTGKNLYYSAEKVTQNETVETVTALIQLKEQTQSPIAETSNVSSTSSTVENLFKSLNDKLEEENIKEKSTNVPESIETSTKSEEKVDTFVSEEKIQESTVSPKITTDKTFEKENVVSTTAQADLFTLSTNTD